MKWLPNRSASELMNSLNYLIKFVSSLKREGEYLSRGNYFRTIPPFVADSQTQTLYFTFDFNLGGGITSVGLAAKASSVRNAVLFLFIAL